MTTQIDFDALTRRFKLLAKYRVFIFQAGQSSKTFSANLRTYLLEANQRDWDFDAGLRSFIFEAEE